MQTGKRYTGVQLMELGARVLVESWELTARGHRARREPATVGDTRRREYRPPRGGTLTFVAPTYTPVEYYDGASWRPERRRVCRG